MFGIDDAILASVAGSTIGGLFNNSAADANRNFQAQQSATAYQRAVADLKKAGLNPMLAYSQGGASTPGGATAAPVNFGDLGYSSAQDARVKKEQVELVKSQVATQEATAADLKASAELKAVEAKLRAVQITAAYQGLDQGQLNIEKQGAEKPFWALNASAQAGKNQLELSKISKEIDVMIQSIATGKASEAQMREMANQLRSSTRNLDLDSAEKEAMAAMWKDLGEGGAIAKTFLPLLRVLQLMFRR